jgi:hypothetical protein
MSNLDTPSSAGKAARRWRNLITAECRANPPPNGELDWVEDTRRLCADIFIL